MLLGILVGYVVAGLICGTVSARIMRGKCDQQEVAFAYFLVWVLLVPAWALGKLFAFLGNKLP